MKRKILAALLSLTLCAASPTNVLAWENTETTSAQGSLENNTEENIVVNGVTYQYQKETDSYILLHGSGQREVLIPREINGKEVTAIAAKAFYLDTNLESIGIERHPQYGYDIKLIGESAFEGCVRLKKVELGASRYEKRAFYGCIRLDKISIGYNAYICSEAFRGCYALHNVYAPYFFDGDSNAFDDDNKIFLRSARSHTFGRLFPYHVIGTGETNPATVYRELEYYDHKIIHCDESVKGKVSILSSVPTVGTIHAIGTLAFYGHENITEIVIPSTVSTIEIGAFRNCPNLERVYIPSNVNDISYDAFAESPKAVIYTSAYSHAARYAKSSGIPCVTDSEMKLSCPVAPVATAKENTVVASLPMKVENAQGYEFIIGNWDCYKKGKPAQTQTCGRKGEVTFQYVRNGVSCIYARAYRTVNGNKEYSDWSSVEQVFVSVVTPHKPTITKVAVSGSTVTVWLSEAKNAVRYDVILSKGRDGAKPLKYAYSKENKKGRKFVFRNVKKGTYYVAARSSNITWQNRNYIYSRWAGMKKAVVK